MPAAQDFIGETSMAESKPPDVHFIIESVEHLIRERPAVGLLDSDTVLAFDIIMHSLQFVNHPQTLDLWREALWCRTVSAITKGAMTEMLEYVNGAIARGELNAAEKICICLSAIVDPAVFRNVRRTAHSLGEGSQRP